MSLFCLLKTAHLRNPTIYLSLLSGSQKAKYSVISALLWCFVVLWLAVFWGLVCPVWFKYRRMIKNPNIKHSSYSNEIVCTELNMSNHGIASRIWAQRTGSIWKLFCEQKFLMNFYTEDKKKSLKLRCLPICWWGYQVKWVTAKWENLFQYF